MRESLRSRDCLQKSLSVEDSARKRIHRTHPEITVLATPVLLTGSTTAVPFRYLRLPQIVPNIQLAGSLHDVPTK
jgi:hypothetical protein